MSRNPAVDAVRIVLCLSTVHMHVQESLHFRRLRPETVGTFTSDRVAMLLALCGTSVFFAISSYFTVANAVTCAGAHTGIGASVAKRWRRLAPLVIAPITLGTFLGAAFRTPSGNVDVAAIAASLAMCANLLPDPYRFLGNSWSSQLWSTFTDLHASALLLIVTRIKLFRESRFAWCIVAACCMVIRFAFMFHNMCVLSQPHPAIDRSIDDDTLHRFYSINSSLLSQPSRVEGCTHLTAREHTNLFSHNFYLASHVRLTPFAIGAYFAVLQNDRVRLSSTSLAVAVALLIGQVVFMVESDWSKEKAVADRVLEAIVLDVVTPWAAMRVIHSARLRVGSWMSTLAKLTPWVYSLHGCAICISSSTAQTIILSLGMAVAAHKWHNHMHRLESNRYLSDGQKAQ